MHVLVTGATGFIGGHSARALLDAGHTVRLLVRDAARLPATLASTDGVEVVPGDMTDAAAVRAATAGCDAVLHAAAIVSLSRGDVEQVMRLNPAGAEIVLGEAATAGLDPIVTVSSAAALFKPGMDAIRVDSPPIDGTPGYGRSKAEVERIARRFQDDGAPVVIVYPTGVIGPPVGTAFGEAARAIESHLGLGYLPVPDARFSVIDVRDLAALHVALFEPGRGPRRHIGNGHTVTMRELAAVYREVTGRRFPVVPCPGAVMRGVGRLNDALARVLPIDTPITTEAMEIFTRWPDADDAGTRAELGITYRPLAATLADTIRALAAAGRVPSRQIGRLAAG